MALVGKIIVFATLIILIAFASAATLIYRFPRTVAPSSTEIENPVVSLSPTPTPMPIPSCSKVEYANGVLVPLSAEWADVTRLAQSLPRSQLAPQISQLQDLHRRLLASSPPDCASRGHELLAKVVSESVESFLALLPNDRMRYQTHWGAARSALYDLLKEYESMGLTVSLQVK